MREVWGLTCHEEVNSKQRATHAAFQTMLRQAHPNRSLKDEHLSSSVVFHFCRLSGISPRDPSAAQEIGWEYNTQLEKLAVSLLPHIPEMAESKPKYNQSTLYGEPDRHLILMTKQEKINWQKKKKFNRKYFIQICIEIMIDLSDILRRKEKGEVNFQLP